MMRMTVSVLSFYRRARETIVTRSRSLCTVPSIPIFGGGDVYTAQGYWESLENSGVDGIMVARGALIKPWIL